MVGLVKRRTHFLCEISHQKILLNGSAHQNGTPPFDDLHLLYQDFFQRSAQELSVIVAHVGDYGKQVTLNQIGRVQSSSQSHLETTGFDLFLLEEHHSHHGQDLEKRAFELLLVDHLEDLVEEVLDELLVDVLRIHLDSLSEGGQVGRNEESGSQVVVLENLGQLVANGALSIGPSYVNEVQVFVRVPEVFGDFLHII